MVSRTLFSFLLVACAIHSLNAWPWDKKTTTTKVPVISREKFLALVAAGSANVTGEVAKSHRLVSEADQANKEGLTLAEVPAEVSAYTERFEKSINEYAENVMKNTTDAVPCVDTFIKDKAEVEAYCIVSAQNLIKEHMQDARNTATKADALLVKIADLTARAQAEAAKPDGEYGADVDAILKEVDAVASDALWNNLHIDVMIHDLKLDIDIAISFTDSWQDLDAALAYGCLCMRRIVRSLSQK